MSKEKANYRETLAFLVEQEHPMVLDKKQAKEILGISLNFLNKLIREGYIKIAGGKIPLGSVANYICG